MEDNALLNLETLMIDLFDTIKYVCLYYCLIFC